MKKIPTLFRRDPENMSRVLDEVTPGCEWVTEGEGVATRKLDGTCCMIDESGAFWKRRTVKRGKPDPETFIFCEEDSNTGKRFGWVLVTSKDKYHVEAFLELEGHWRPGTYELLGPKIQGNPEQIKRHTLWRHASPTKYPDAPRSFDGIRGWFDGKDIEGLVFHHPDGRMAKIKLRDFDIQRAT